MRLGLTIIIILILSSLSSAQNTSSCLTESQLLNLQSLSYDRVKTFLKSEGWSTIDDNENQTGKFFGTPLDYSIEKWQNKKTNFIEGVLCLYYKPGLSNLIAYQNPDNICFNYLLKNQGGSKPSTTRDKLIKSSSFNKSGGVVMDFREYFNDNSPLRFSIVIYNASSVNEQIQVVKDTLAAREARRLAAIADELARQEARRKAESDRNDSINLAINSGNSLFNDRKYSEAIVKYQKAKKFLTEEEVNRRSEIEVKIVNCNKNINRITIENSISEGDYFYNQKKFDSAVTKYEYALSYYKSYHSNFLPDPTAKLNNKIKDTKEILAVLVLQKTPQSYSSLNPSDYKTFINNNYKSIDAMISELKRSGNVRYRAVIKFDNFGKNLSYADIEFTSSKAIDEYNKSIRFSDLTPVSKLGYFIPSIEVLPFNIAWNSYNLKAKSRLSQIRIKPIEKIPSGFNYNIQSFIGNQSFKRGIFTFEVVEKNVNKKAFTDLNLIKYWNNCGPFNSIFSIILPGWGTSKVADTKKGGGRMALFLISSAISVGSKIYSDKEYAKYINSVSSGRNGNSYNVANTANKVFLISGGIAATIYVYDFFWVIGKGIKNLNQSKELRNKLKTGTIKIIDSPVKP